MSDNLRWIVETTKDSFEDVGATTLDVDGACLVFRNEDGSVLVAYAPGTWLTVCEQ